MHEEKNGEVGPSRDALDRQPKESLAGFIKTLYKSELEMSDSNYKVMGWSHGSPKL